MSLSENSNVEVLDAKSSEEAILDYTQSIRRKVIDKFTNEGKTMPSDKGEAMIVLSALNDMDKPVLIKMRIKSDDKNAKVNAQGTAVVAHMLSKMVPRNLQSEIDENRITPQLSSDIGNPDLVDGELVTGTQSEEYCDFIKKLES